MAANASTTSGPKQSSSIVLISGTSSGRRYAPAGRAHDGGATVGRAAAWAARIASQLGQVFW